MPVPSCYLSLEMLKHRRTPEFFGLIKASLRLLKRLTLVFLRVLLVIITGFRKLKVDSIFVNNEFLLSNGLVIIHWKAKNVLWISVQGKWIGGQRERVLVYSTKDETTLSIHIQGLFSNYKESFILSPLATLAVPGPPPIRMPAPAVSNKIIPLPIPVLSPNYPIRGIEFSIKVHAFDITIPPFQTDSHEPKKLLHNS